MQSAFKPSSASTSLVAATPSGPLPASSPASTPTLASLCTHPPTRSSSGCAAIASIAARPTPPVAHWITEIVMPGNLGRVRRQRKRLAPTQWALQGRVMRLLVLGGTRFVGRSVVLAALERGWEVTALNRGVTGALPDDVQALVAARTDPEQLANALQGKDFDAAVDTWSGAPRVVQLAAQLLKGS